MELISNNLTKLEAPFFTNEMKGIVSLYKSSIITKLNLIDTQINLCVWGCVPVAYQCSSRGGELELEVRDDGRINIAGQTVTVLKGTITL